MDAEQPAGVRRDRAVAIAAERDDGTTTPRVIASGSGLLARQIVDTAFALGIKVREDPDLAEMLAAVDLNSAIPTEALIAVADILAHLYRANQEVRPGGGNDHVVR